MEKLEHRRYPEEVYTSWVRERPNLTDTSLLIKEYQVMQRWESNYMKSLAAIATSGGGDILEVGFGMGISARYIQKSMKINSHTIAECHPEVIKSASDLFREDIASRRVRLIEGFWEDRTPEIPDESFDGILFDSCPLDSGVEYFQFFPFFKEAHRLLKEGGTFTYFSDEATEISDTHRQELIKAGFRAEDINFKICKVNPPISCEYWKHNTIVSPIVKKNSGTP